MATASSGPKTVVAGDRSGSRVVDYDRIAPTYDERYRRPESEGLSGVLELLKRIAAEVGARRILEVGCGTGFWLAALANGEATVVGLDFSAGMLDQARARSRDYGLVRATASRLPFLARSFDLVFAMNAVHHFDDARAFVAEAAHSLRPGGALVTIGMDPSQRRDRWFVYDFFPGTREADVARYPSCETISGWMHEAGFGAVETGVAHRIVGEHLGRAVLDEPTLQKHGTSQLVLLSDAAYRAGRRRIDAAIAQGEANDTPARFPVDIALASTIGRLSG